VGTARKRIDPGRLKLVLYVAIVSSGTLGRGIDAGRAAYLPTSRVVGALYNTTNMSTKCLTRVLLLVIRALFEQVC
jgi:hypothetical protein